MRTALLVIATGIKYWQYVQPLLDSANEFFVDHEAIVWSDHPQANWAAINIRKEPLGYPGETLYRYHTFLNHVPLLRQYDQLFYIDADMRFIAPVGEEIFSNGITATLHPGYVGTVGTPERNPDSTAMIPFNAQNRYFCGGFNGGRAADFLNMAEVIKTRIDIDTKRGLIAIWHDESHLNWYMYQCAGPEVTLDPSYCYPEDAGVHYLNKWKMAGINPTPKILALTKAGK